MDGKQFDAFTRSLADAGSRRSLLKRALGAALGVGLAAAAVDGTDAIGPRKPGQVCRGDGDCASGRCSDPDRKGRRRCLCTGAADCTQPSNPCKSAACSASGTCVVSTNVGATCDTGDRCVKNGVCTDRARCVGTPVVCTASDQCHDAGVCDKATGTCSNPPKADGTGCEDGNLCTQGDTCQGGVCRPGPLVDCSFASACIERSFCNSGTGQCVYVNKTNGIACTDSGRCLDPDRSVCRDGECYGPSICPPCQICMNGTCSIPPGPVDGFSDIRCDQPSICCQGQCVDHTSDEGHCGNCYSECIGGSTCQGGVCSGPDCTTPLSCTRITIQ